GAVVDDDHLPVGERLALHRLERRSQEVARLIGRDDHAHQGHGGNVPDSPGRPGHQACPPPTLHYPPRRPWRTRPLAAVRPMHVVFVLPPFEVYSPSGGLALAIITNEVTAELRTRGVHTTVVTPT